MRCKHWLASLLSIHCEMSGMASTAFGVLIPPNHATRRSSSCGADGHRKSWQFRSCYLGVIILFICTFLITGHGYFSSFFPSQSNFSVNKIIEGDSLKNSCDIFSGKWVYDETYPLHNASVCPFAEEGFLCQNNGRQDEGYMKWRWQPMKCDIPKFNADDILKRLQGLRVVFVGDSMGRTQWESLICLLMQGVADKRSVYEVNGKRITKRIPILRVRFSSFNFTVEYYRSPFLVQQNRPPNHVPKRVHSTLKLDKVDLGNKRWLEADILIFNSGHWWTVTKTFQMGCYFQVGDSLKLGMKIEDAYRTALSTWASWVEGNVNTNRTQVYFRSFEPSHWRYFGPKGACKLSPDPISDPGSLTKYPLSEILLDVVSHMKAPVTILNVTTLSAYRSDAHVGKWSNAPAIPDCSHWCLPGVPDIWNELLFASLLMKGQGVWASH